MLSHIPSSVASRLLQTHVTGSRRLGVLVSSPIKWVSLKGGNEGEQLSRRGACFPRVSSWESEKTGRELSAFCVPLKRVDAVPHLLCQRAGDGMSPLWSVFSIFPRVCDQQEHTSQRLTWQEEEWRQLSYLFQWQSRSGKLIKFIIQTSKHQE